MRTTRILVVLRRLAISLLVLAPVGAGATAADGVLDVSRARLVTRGDAPASTARDSLGLRADFPQMDVLRGFDPSLDAVRVSVAGVDVIATQVPDDAKAFRVDRHGRAVRRIRFREPSQVAGTGARRLEISARSGRLHVSVRRADLRAISAHGASDVAVTVAVGEAVATSSIRIDVRSR